MVFYDFEVFKYDWLVVLMDSDEQKETVIVNDKNELNSFHEKHINDVWVGFNSRNYDQYILKGILCGFDPKKINDHIIKDGQRGFTFSNTLRKIPLNNYDVMTGIDRGLKMFEGFMGNDIRESSVPFDIDRKLTDEEIEETVKYCRHDVEQTIEIFIQRRDDFEATIGLIKLASEGKTNLSLINHTNPQLSAMILNARKRDYKDEFNIDIPPTLEIEKYKEVVDWYKNPENLCYEKDGDKNQLNIKIAGVDHQFGYGGVHGAINGYHNTGLFINMDVTSLYPSLMIKYNLGSRSMKNPEKYEEIYTKRLQYKKEGNPLQAALKLVLNSTYGVMKDKSNSLHDPRQANRVCVYGQLLLLDLIEHLEPYCELIQSNTDGILIRKPDNFYPDEWFDMIDDIAYEWEKRTMLQLEFEEFIEVFQKDVNNYVIIDSNGNYKSKGAYVKKLSPLDYDLPIINKALINYMVKGESIEDTIFSCDDLQEFQFVTKITNKYLCIIHGDEILKEKCVRVFASTDSKDGGLMKYHATTHRPAKVSNSPHNCFIFNDDVHGVKAPKKLNKQWYVETAYDRLKGFGI